MNVCEAKQEKVPIVVKKVGFTLSLPLLNYIYNAVSTTYNVCASNLPSLCVKSRFVCMCEQASLVSAQVSSH